MGNIITFYSYKGGVGRSMALANIGMTMARWGKKTLLIDWDLEAPGLENYFKPLLPDYGQVLAKEGLIDILHRKTMEPSFSNETINWKDYLVQVRFENCSNLFVLTSGKRDEQYINKVRQFDFSTFYNEHDGGDFLEEIRSSWKKDYDIVLIDSRTGLTDSSGVCSIQMPDIVVLMFTATEQGFNGTLNVVNRAKLAQESLIYDRLKLMALPIPTRFDNSELKLTEEWLNKFSVELEGVYRDFIPLDKDKNLMIQPIDILKKTKVPYISFYSYGEKLPVLEQGGDDPNSIGYVYETIAAILVNNFKNIHKLKEERDLYIKMAKGEEVADFSHYEKIAAELEEKTKLVEELHQKEKANLAMARRARLINYSSIGVGIILAAFLVIPKLFETKTTIKDKDLPAITNPDTKATQKQIDTTYKYLKPKRKA